MRTTQFIGLTNKCKEQVKGLTAITAKGWSTFGMFEEDLSLSCYYDQEGSLVAVEFVVATPWSSGPMIFTGLVLANGLSPYNWKEDPLAAGRKFDSEEGIYYV